MWRGLDRRATSVLSRNAAKVGGMSDGLTQIPKFGIVLVLVVVLVLGAWGFRDRKETDVLQLICSVSLIGKRSGFSRTRTSTLKSRELFWVRHEHFVGSRTFVARGFVARREQARWVARQLWPDSFLV